VDLHSQSTPANYAYVLLSRVTKREDLLILREFDWRTLHRKPNKELVQEDKRLHKIAMATRVRFAALFKTHCSAYPPGLPQVPRVHIRFSALLMSFFLSHVSGVRIERPTLPRANNPRTKMDLHRDPTLYCLTFPVWIRINFFSGCLLQTPLDTDSKMEYSKPRSPRLPPDENSVANLQPDRFTFVTLSSLAQNNRNGEELHCGYYAANAATIMRDEAPKILKEVQARKFISSSGFIGTNRLNSSAFNRQVFLDRMKDDFVPRLQLLHQTESIPTNLREHDIEELVCDASIPVISSCLASRTVLRAGNRDPKLDALLQRLARDRYAICILNTTQSEDQGQHWVAVMLLQPSDQPHFLAFICNSLLRSQSPNDSGNAGLAATLLQTLRLYARTDFGQSALFNALNQLDHLCDRFHPGASANASLWSLAFSGLCALAPNFPGALRERVEAELNEHQLSIMDSAASADSTALSYASKLSVTTKTSIDDHIFAPLAQLTVKPALQVLFSFPGRIELMQLTKLVKTVKWSAISSSSLPSLLTDIRSVGNRMWRQITSSSAADLGLYLELMRKTDSAVVEDSL